MSGEGNLNFELSVEGNLDFELSVEGNLNFELSVEWLPPPSFSWLLWPVVWGIMFPTVRVALTVQPHQRKLGLKVVFTLAKNLGRPSLLYTVSVELT